MFNPPTTMLYAVFARLVALMLLAVPTAFLTAAAGTERHDDANRSIGETYCVGTAGNGPYAAAGIVVAATSSSSAHYTHTSLINTITDNIF